MRHATAMAACALVVSVGGGLILSTSAPAQQQISLYGITLGSPLQIPQCMDAGVRPEMVMCYRPLSETPGGRLPGETVVTVFFADGQKPRHTFSTLTFYARCVSVRFMNTAAERIIAKFGGLSAMARALGHENPSTVQGWKERGVIPARQQAKVLDAGRGLREPVTINDFFDMPDESDEPAASPTPEPAEAAQ